LFHIPIYFKKLLFIYNKDAALQVYWMPHYSSENSFKRKYSIIPAGQQPVSQAVLWPLKGWMLVLRIIYYKCMVSKSGTKVAKKMITAL
jgi:hypothetical protein